MSSRIKAFTLLEMIVVMLISSIVIAIAYQGYSIFFKQFLSFKKNVEENSRVSDMDVLLFKDFSDSKEVRRNSNKLIVSYKDKNVLYILDKDLIIRQQGVTTDSFVLKECSVSTNFLGKASMDNDLIDEIRIEVIMGEEETREFYYKKKYAADVIMNNVKPE